MEMTSAVMRFALASYFIKTGGTARSFQSCSKLPSSSTEPNLAGSSKDEASQNVDFNLSDVISIHVSNLKQLLMERRFQDWFRGIDELREFVAMNTVRIGPLLTVLVKIIKTQEQDVEVVSLQVIEHMCFENNGEPSKVFDQLLETLGHYSDDEHLAVARWVGKAVDIVMHRLMQFHEQRFGTTVDC